MSISDARRCTARSKRTGQQCKGPAVRGWQVCRFHGAGGGAPCGERNGNYRHGQYTTKAIAERREVAALIKAAKKFTDQIV